MTEPARFVTETATIEPAASELGDSESLEAR